VSRPMSEGETLEERRASLVIKYRGMKVESKDRDQEKIVYHLSKGEEKYIMHCILGINTIGISYVRDIKKAVEKEGADSGIIVGDGKYTYSARSSSEEMGVELIPPNLPTFDVFEHELVPIHEIVSEADREELAERYHTEPYKFPWIKATDPISIILGAKPGDILKITQKSETAGRSVSYRYVV